MFILLQKLVPQHWLSRLVGFVAASRVRWIRYLFIHIVIRVFRVDLREAEREDPDSYDSFNDFFTRALKPGIRPVTGLVACPADGAVSAVGRIEGNQVFQAKGLTYSLEKLLGTSDVDKFRDGSFITVYLSPKDYHRVHNPVAGRCTEGTYIPGKLFSVNDTTAAAVQDLFADNERYVMRFETEQGAMAVVLVGAMIVAGIQTVWRQTHYPAGQYLQERFGDEKHFRQGDELGRFLMGSTAIVLLENPVEWQVRSGETVRMGQALAEKSGSH